MTLECSVMRGHSWKCRYLICGQDLSTASTALSVRLGQWSMCTSSKDLEHAPFTSAITPSSVTCVLAKLMNCKDEEARPKAWREASPSRWQPLRFRIHSCGQDAASFIIARSVSSVHCDNSTSRSNGQHAANISTPSDVTLVLFSINTRRSLHEVSCLRHSSVILHREKFNFFTWGFTNLPMFWSVISPCLTSR